MNEKNGLIGACAACSTYDPESKSVMDCVEGKKIAEYEEYAEVVNYLECDDNTNCTNYKYGYN